MPSSRRHSKKKILAKPSNRHSNLTTVIFPTQRQKIKTWFIGFIWQIGPASEQARVLHWWLLQKTQIDATLNRLAKTIRPLSGPERKTIMFGAKDVGPMWNDKEEKNDKVSRYDFKKALFSHNPIWVPLDSSIYMITWTSSSTSPCLIGTSRSKTRSWGSFRQPLAVCSYLRRLKLAFCSWCHFMVCWHSLTPGQFLQWTPHDLPVSAILSLSGATAMDSLEDPVVPSCLGKVCWSNAEVAPVSWGNLTQGHAPICAPEQVATSYVLVHVKSIPTCTLCWYFYTPLTKSWIVNCKGVLSFSVERFKNICICLY